MENIEIPIKECVDAMPVLFPDMVVRQELKISLPGVTEE